jgi:hypothetical protein
MRNNVMRTGPTVVGAAVIAAMTAVAAAMMESGPRCRPDGALVPLPDVPEASGVAVTGTPRHIWVNNDSGLPVLFAVDENGRVSSRLRLTGITMHDWEATVSGPCPGGGTCLFLADIGDNHARRQQISVHRIPAPRGSSGSTGDVAVHDTFVATYPDGSHDAETLLITPKGEMLIVTKGDTGPVALYRFPTDARPNSMTTLDRVGPPRPARETDGKDHITDGAISPNGEWTVLRTNRDLIVYRTADLLAGRWREAGRVDLSMLREPQGEGVAFADESTLYLVGEGGGKGRPGTLVRMTCRF